MTRIKDFTKHAIDVLSHPLSPVPILGDLAAYRDNVSRDQQRALEHTIMERGAMYVCYGLGTSMLYSVLSR